MKKKVYKRRRVLKKKNKSITMLIDNLEGKKVRFRNRNTVYNFLRSNSYTITLRSIKKKRIFTLSKSKVKGLVRA